MTVNGIGTTEYNQNVSANQSARTTETAYTNSVMTQAQGSESASSAENTSNTSSSQASELDKQLEQLCARLKKYNVTVEDIKKSGLIEKICGGATLEQIAKVPQEKQEKLFKALEQAIIDAFRDNKVDWEKAADLGKDYLIALNTGWTIKGFKVYNKTVKQSSLLQRLIETKCLPEGTTVDNVSMDELKAAVKKFCGYLVGEIKAKPTEKDKLAQLQTFGRLLINSPAEEKELFLEVIKSLYAENRGKALDAVITSSENREQRSQLAKAAADPEYIKAITTEPIRNSEGEIVNSDVMSQDDATEVAQIIYRNLSEEDTPSAHENYDNARRAWFEQNKEILTSIEEKVRQAEENGVEPEFTEEEKQVLLEQQNYIIGASSGEFIGTIENQNLSEDFRNEHLKLLNSDSYELPVYRDILEQINNYAENNPDSISIPKEELIKILDNATNGNYTTVSTGSDKELNPPVQPQEESYETPDLGFTQRESVDTERLALLRQQIADSTDRQTGFKVENPIKQNKADESFSAKMAEASSGQDKLAVIKEFFDRSPMLKKALEKYLTGMTDSLYILNALPTNARKYLAQRLTQKGLLDESDIQKLNLSFSEKQLLNNILTENEKKAETV